MDYFAVIYFISVWLVSALAGCFRCVRNGEFKSIGHTISVAGVSGFFGLGVVCICSVDVNDPGFNGSYYIGIASIAGLAGKEQKEILSIIWKSVIQKFIPVESVNE